MCPLRGQSLESRLAAQRGVEPTRDGSTKVTGPVLVVDAVYDDDDLLELRVTISNGSFSGGTSVYVDRDALESCAALLKGFPAPVQDERVVEWGDSDVSSSLGGVKLRFLCIDASGHAGVWAELRSSDSLSGVMPHQTVRLFLPIEAAAVDRFVDELAIVGAKKRGRAQLTGGPTTGCN